VKDDIAGKINPIPSIQVKTFMSRENEPIDIIDSSPEQPKSQGDNMNNIFFMDDNMGGIEYYNYLEKTVNYL
jgi:hypothetical protein